MRTFLTLAILLAFLGISMLFGYVAWMELQGVEISRHGWIALTLGAFLTLSVGAGLMALMFFSHRRGYDDRANRPDD
ncbi:MAG: hypothetical protein OEU92_11820 [Alphaproteobacteria bacterium]|nr:hypothetical protein [Alphaproteobacteria bacterium]